MPGRCPGRDVQAQAQALVGEQGPQQADQLLKHRFELDPLQAHRDLPRLDARDVQDVVDHGAQVAPRLVDDLGLPSVLGIESGLVVGEHLGEQQDGVERGTQLVADVGQELRLVAVGLLQLLGMLAGGAQELRVGLRQGGEAVRQLAYLPRPLPAEADRPSLPQDPADASGQLLAETLHPFGAPAGQEQNHQDEQQDDTQDARHEGIAEVGNGGLVHWAANPQGHLLLGEEHGYPQHLLPVPALPQGQLALGEDLRQPREVLEGLRFCAHGPAGAQVAPVGVDP